MHCMGREPSVDEGRLYVLDGGQALEETATCGGERDSSQYCIHFRLIMGFGKPPPSHIPPCPAPHTCTPVRPPAGIPQASGCLTVSTLMKSACRQTVVSVVDVMVVVLPPLAVPSAEAAVELPLLLVPAATVVALPPPADNPVVVLVALPPPAADADAETLPLPTASATEDVLKQAVEAARTLKTLAANTSRASTVGLPQSRPFPLPSAFCCAQG